MIAYGGYQKELKNASLRAQKFLENNSEYIKNNKALEIWGKTHNFEGYIMGGARGQKTIPHK
ncbi:MAG: hypothetical protein LBL75_03370 [Rickettsiales bacterium]|nr:hypothetical protein [Rickettsiales bacterium]